MKINNLITVTIASTLLPLSMYSQGKIISISPESNKEGKLLTMEETILSKNILPERKSVGWEKKEEKIKVFSKNGNIYYKDDKGKTQLIVERENNQITYGESVSRNEFGITNGLFISNSGKKLAFYRKDETLVSDFPLLDINTRTGSLVNIKYPMNGMPSEMIQVGIYDFENKNIVYVKAEDFGKYQYLTNISWGAEDKYIFIQVLDRVQKNMHLNMYDTNTGLLVKTILTEHNARFVEPQDPIYFIKSSDKFIYRTDNRDGFKNLYICDLYGKVERLTKVDADVNYIGNDGKYVYYTSAEISPIENHLFRIKIKNKKPERLTKEEGWHNIKMNEECTEFYDTYSSLNVPKVINRKKADGKIIENILIAQDPLRDYAKCEVSLGTVKSADGKYDNYYRLFKPLNFDPNKKYPVILYVYGGPHSQLVTNSWLGNIRMWEMYMAQRGYIVYVQDNRGTLNRGAEFEKAIHKQCGQAEMADQMMGIEMLLNMPYVDKERIGVHGWSYGGFMTISLMTSYPEIFKAGVAGGPVIDWKWYEVMYGERYMETPATNAEGFEKTSLLNKVTKLKGKLLICQGAIDNTVVWEHSLSFVNECIKNNVQLDYFPYPCAQHNVYGKDRVHLMNKVSLYFENNL